eukprot:COSAG06_NODE_955_length_11326_cov_6.392358_7_plen_235_part_00
MSTRVALLRNAQQLLTRELELLQPLIHTCSYRAATRPWLLSMSMSREVVLATLRPWKMGWQEQPYDWLLLAYAVAKGLARSTAECSGGRNVALPDRLECRQHPAVRVAMDSQHTTIDSTDRPTDSSCAIVCCAAHIAQPAAAATERQPASQLRMVPAIQPSRLSMRCGGYLVSKCRASTCSASSGDITPPPAPRATCCCCGGGGRVRADDTAADRPASRSACVAMYLHSRTCTR